MSEKKQALRIFVPFPVWWLIWIAFYYYFEFHIFKIIERKILNVKIEWITHSTHDTGERFFFQAAIKCFWKRCTGMKFPALGGHSIEVDCNVIEKSLHFMHFCTIDFEEMTDPRFLSILIFLTLILITKYSDQFWEVHFIVLKPRKERPRKIKVEHWIIFFNRITYRSLLSTGSSRQCNYCSGMNRQKLR